MWDTSAIAGEAGVVMRKWFAALLLLSLSVPFHGALAQAGAHATVSARAMAQARTEGTVRVLVAFRDPGVAAATPKARMRAVADTADALLSRLPARGHDVRRRFALVPALAMDVDLATLRALARDPAVARVDIDAPGTGHAVAADEASFLNQVEMLQGLGLDGSGQKVAVVDSGVASSHPDLASRLIDEQCFCSGASGSVGCCPNRQDTQSGVGAAFDDNGHGTNVSGIIVGEGIVAPRGAVPAADLVAVKVLDSGNSFCCSSDVVAALDWIAIHHPDVAAVNLSLGTNALFPGDCDNASSFTRAMADAVDVLTHLGAVVTVSTGNQGNATMTSAPSCVRNAVGVGATWDFAGGPVTFLGCTDASTAPKQPTCFSNRSATTDLYAAGAFVTSAGRFGGTSSYGGTSQAAPMVAACAVALKQAVPVSTPADRIDAMKLAPTTVQHGAHAYPFLDCASAVMLFVAPRMCASGDPTCCGPGELDCTGGVRPVPQSLPPGARARAHADSTVP